MYHSVNFIIENTVTHTSTVYNTYDTWHLIPEAAPSMAPPSVQYKGTDEFPDRPLWYTDSFRSILEKRSGEWSFIVDKNYPGYNWSNLYTDIASKIHGKVFKISLEDDPGYHYVGTLEVKSWTVGEHWPTVSIGYECEPYKYGELEVVEFNDGTTVQTREIINSSNYESPATLKLTPRITGQILTISGLTQDNIVLNGCEGNVEIEINGYMKRIRSSKPPSEYMTIWQFPRLSPGSNIVNISATSGIFFASVEYNPIYI